MEGLVVDLVRLPFISARVHARHQDIKPSNIIHRNSTIYFTDFSSASQFEIGQTTSTENPARTSAMYAAPEVIDTEQGLGLHGRGTDVFALGLVFTKMLAVIQGSSVAMYQQFLIKYPHTKPWDPSAGPAFLYVQELDSIEPFFSSDTSRFFLSCITSMLSSDRDQRPDAREVTAGIRASGLPTCNECGGSM